MDSDHNFVIFLFGNRAQLKKENGLGGVAIMSGDKDQDHWEYLKTQPLDTLLFSWFYTVL